jgi:hypothetical protein
MKAIKVLNWSTPSKCYDNIVDVISNVYLNIFICRVILGEAQNYSITFEDSRFYLFFIIYWNFHGNQVICKLLGKTILQRPYNFVLQ